MSNQVYPLPSLHGIIQTDFFRYLQLISVDNPFDDLSPLQQLFPEDTRQAYSHNNRGTPGCRVKDDSPDGDIEYLFRIIHESFMTVGPCKLQLWDMPCT